MISPIFWLSLHLGPNTRAAVVQQPTTPVLPQQGPIPPLDPRLVPPAVTETSIPPGVQVPPPPSGSQETSPITANDAARIALRQQPNVGIAQSSVTVQQGITQQARSALLPHLTILGGYSFVVNVSNPGTSSSSVSVAGTTTSLATGFSAEGTLTQLVFDFNHALDTVRQNAALDKAAVQNLSAVQSDTVLQVKQAFYALKQNLDQVQVDQLEVENRQSQLDLARSRYNVGLGIPSDVVTAETAKAEAIVTLTQAKATAEQSRIALAVLMGIDPRTPIQPAPTSEPTLASNDVNSLTDIALRQRPDVLKAQFTVRSAQYGVSAARTTNTPALSLGASFVSTGNEIFPQENNLILGVNLSWTPIDGGLTRGLVEEARGNLGIAQKQLYIAQQTAKSDVATAYVNLKSAEEEMPVVNADVANAELGVRIATGRYSTGVGMFVDILNAQAFLLTARTNLVSTESAIEQYRVALAHAIFAPITDVTSLFATGPH